MIVPVGRSCPSRTILCIFLPYQMRIMGLVDLLQCDVHWPIA